MSFWRQNIPPSIKKAKQNSDIKKEETMANFPKRDIKKHNYRKQKEEGNRTHKIRVHKCKNQEEVCNGVRSKIIRAAYISHGRKQNSFKKECQTAESSQNEEKPKEKDKRFG